MVRRRLQTSGEASGKAGDTSSFLVTCSFTSLAASSAAAALVAASALAAMPAMHTALMAFGTAALLYLVTVELLHEAHQAMKGHTWWIELQFFVGFALAIVLEKLEAGVTEAS